MGHNTASTHPKFATPFPGLDRLQLKSGGHEGPEQGACIMEAVAWFRGIEWTDRPACVCPVLVELGQKINDSVPDDVRQGLVPFIPVVVGTAGDGLAARRSYMILDWIIRTTVPAWFRATEIAELEEIAREIEGLQEIVDEATRPPASEVTS